MIRLIMKFFCLFSLLVTGRFTFLLYLCYVVGLVQLQQSQNEKNGEEK